MDFRIADTFTDSLARLTGDEQKAAKTTAFDLQVNPAGPGLSFHKLEKSKDKNFWSVRVSSDIRLIVHKTQSGLLLCYVTGEILLRIRGAGSALHLSCGHFDGFDTVASWHLHRLLILSASWNRPVN
jgi:mRNA-degrading endonuclease RelE of RelBE toxin-antitoxin system